MKLETKTIEILQNFAAINPNLVVKNDKRVDTINDAKSIYAISNLTFDVEFGIYDLNEFLSVHSLIDSAPGNEDTELEFSDKSVRITKATSSANYRFADPNILTHPLKSISMPDVDASVQLSHSQLSQLRKAATVLRQSVLSINGNSGVITARICDPKNSSANSFDIILDSNNANKGSFEFHILISNLKLLNGNYTLELSKRFISHWIYEDSSVEYFISLEKTSSYNS